MEDKEINNLIGQKLFNDVYMSMSNVECMNYEPTKNLNQAWQCLQKLPKGVYFTVTINKGRYLINLIDENIVTKGWAYCDDLSEANFARAICVAMLRLIGEYKEEK